MRRFLPLVIFILFSSALVVLGFAGLARATNGVGGESKLEAGQSYSGTYNRVASVVRIDGDINGNVFVAGNEILIAGNINGDVYAAGQNVSIKGKVTGTVHAAAGRIDISGEVGNMLIAAGNTVTVEKEAKIGRGAMLAGSLVNIWRPVGGAVYSAGSEVNINSDIKGDTSLAAGNIVIGRDAHIQGNLKYNDSAKAMIANDSNVAGSITKFHTGKSQQKALADLSGKVLYGIISRFIIGLVLILIMPASVVATAEYMQARPGKTVLVGLAFLILTPIAIIGLLITVFGLSLAIVLGLAYIQAMFISGVFVSLWLGRKIVSVKNQTPRSNIWALLIGLIAVEIVIALPVIGGLAGFAVLLFGLGSIVARSYDRLMAVRHKQLALK